MSSHSQELYSFDLLKVDIVAINRYANQGRSREPEYRADDCSIDSVVEVLSNHLDYLNVDCETEFLRHQLARINQTYGKFDYQHCELWRKYLTLAQSSDDWTTVGYYRFLGTITEMAEMFDFGLDHYQDQADLLTEFITAAETIAQKDIFSLADSLWFQAQVKRLQKALTRVRVELD